MKVFFCFSVLITYKKLPKHYDVIVQKGCEFDVTKNFKSSHTLMNNFLQHNCQIHLLTQLMVLVSDFSVVFRGATFNTLFTRQDVWYARIKYNQQNIGKRQCWHDWSVPANDCFMWKHYKLFVDLRIQVFRLWLSEDYILTTWC